MKEAATSNLPFTSDPMDETPVIESAPGPHPPTSYGRLVGAIEEAVQAFDHEAATHKNLHRSLRILGFTLTGLATILAAAGMISEWPAPKLQFLIVIVTAVATALNAYEALRNPSELWINERKTCHALRDLLREVKYGGSDRVYDPDEYFERLQLIIQSSGDRWNELLKEARVSQRGEPTAPAAEAEAATIKMPI
jgi:hypothetical protein